MRLDELIDEAIVRARRNAPTVAFDAKLKSLVIDDRERLVWAVNNLLHNAAPTRHPARSLRCRCPMTAFASEITGLGSIPLMSPTYLTASTAERNLAVAREAA